MSSNNRYKLEDNSDLETINSFKILISNIKALKDKTWGCPWQKIQSHVSLIPFLYEESNEFIDAIYEKNAENICEELGDLLLQVMLHSEIGYEEKKFALNDVIKNLNKKIINRHPYIFKKKEKVTEKVEPVLETPKEMVKSIVSTDPENYLNVYLKAEEKNGSNYKLYSDEEIAKFIKKQEKKNKKLRKKLDKIKKKEAKKKAKKLKISKLN